MTGFAGIAVHGDRGVLLVVDRVVAVGLVVLADELDHARLELHARLAARDQALLLRDERRIAVGRAQRVVRAVDIGRHRAVGQLACLDDRRLVGGPQRLEVAFGLLAIGGRHLRERELLHGALVGADLEHVDGDAELVEHVVQVVAIARVAVDGDRAGGLQPHLVGLRHQVVLLLTDVGAVGEHLLAGGTELAQRGGHGLELGQAATGHLAGVEHERGDARVLGRRADRVGEFLDQGLGIRAPGRLGKCPVDGISRQLLYEAALGSHVQCRMTGQHGGWRMERRPHDHEDEQQQDEVQELAHAVEAAPQAAEESGKRCHAGPVPV